MADGETTPEDTLGKSHPSFCLRGKKKFDYDAVFRGKKSGVL